MAEKTEKPTQKKLRDSAKKGQSFKSKDMVSWCSYFAGISVIYFYLDLSRFADFVRSILLYPSKISPSIYFETLLSLFMIVIFSVAFITILTSAIMSLMQTRFLLATEAIKLDFKHLDFIQGIKRLFSKRSIKNLIKSLLFMVIFVFSFYIFAVLNFHDISRGYTNLSMVVKSWLWLCFQFILFFMLFSAPIVFLDALAEFFLFMKDMKMEKHEVKQESKDIEGKPEIKSKRKQIHYEIMNEEMKKPVAKSSIVLTNPTHISIGIAIDFSFKTYPIITLKETDEKAQIAQKLAREMRIPVVRNIKLARKLYATYRVNEPISIADIRAIIDVIVWLRDVEMTVMKENELDTPEDMNTDEILRDDPDNGEDNNIEDRSSSL